MNEITSEDLSRWSELLKSGNRAEFYWQYYQKSGQYQSLVQAMITSYSGVWGGLAVTGNYFAKLSRPDLYNITLDDFSISIAKATLDSIEGKGGDYILTESEMLASDYQQWRNVGLEYGGSAALGDNFPGLGSANPIAGTFPLAVSLQFAFNAADTSKYFDPKVPPPGIAKFEEPLVGAWELGNRYNDFSEENFNKYGPNDLGNENRFYRVYERLQDGTDGNLVFVADSRITEATWLDDYAILKVADNQKDNIESLQPDSPEYLARQALWKFTQSNYPIGSEIPEFEVGQIPPNLFFTNADSNGVRTVGIVNKFQQILESLAPIESLSSPDFNYLSRDQFADKFSEITDEREIERTNIFGLGTSLIFSLEGRKQGVEGFVDSLSSLFLLDVDAGMTYDEKD